MLAEESSAETLWLPSDGSCKWDGAVYRLRPFQDL